MRVAVPLFGTRVAPRFDSGAVLLLAELGDGKVLSSRQIADATTHPLRRVARLRELGVDAVVCGAVTGFVVRLLTANGIRVFGWVFAEAAEALGAWRGPTTRGLWRGRPSVAWVNTHATDLEGDTRCHEAMAQAPPEAAGQAQDAAEAAVWARAQEGAVVL